MRKTLVIASALAVLSAAPAFASSDSAAFPTPKVTAPAYQTSATVERGYSAADDFRLSSKDSFPAANVGIGQQADNIDRGVVTSGVPVKRLPDAATEQFKVSDD